MKAIQTKYHGPTNTRGSRIIAKCDGGSVMVSYDHALNNDRNHAAAAQALMRKMAWTGNLEAGTLPDGTVAHVLTSCGGDAHVRTLLWTILQNLEAGHNPYSRPGVKDALTYLNMRAGDTSGPWSDAWREVKS